MKKLVAAGVFIVVLVELVAFAVLDRELVLLVGRASWSPWCCCACACISRVNPGMNPAAL